MRIVQFVLITLQNALASTHAKNRRASRQQTECLVGRALLNPIERLRYWRITILVISNFKRNFFAVFNFGFTK